MAIGWLDLELRHLRTFTALAEERSFRATAKRLGFAQSAISRHISMLERRVGVGLVTRGQGNRGVGLTDAGWVLLEHAEAILSLVAVAERDFAHRARRSAATIRVASFQSVSATLLAAAIADRKGLDASIEVELVDATEPVEKLRAGEVDLAFTEMPPNDPAVAHVELLNDPYLLVSHIDGTETPPSSEPVSLEELSGLPLLAYRQSCHLAAVEAELRARGIIFNWVFRHDDAMTLQSLAASGTGAALLPRLAVAPAPSVQVRLVEAAFRARSICLAWNADSPPRGRVAAFAETIRQVASGVESPAAAEGLTARRARAA
jgi:DNA-binding transcriptional LysR family regulator